MGKGQFSCAGRKCEVKDDLVSYEARAQRALPPPFAAFSPTRGGMDATLILKDAAPGSIKELLLSPLAGELRIRRGWGGEERARESPRVPRVRLPIATARHLRPTAPPAQPQRTASAASDAARRAPLSPGLPARHASESLDGALVRSLGLLQPGRSRSLLFPPLEHS